MIDEGRTLEIYGYTSDELSPQSNKPIVAVCEECGRYRVMKKQSYSELCRACACNEAPPDATCSVCGEVGVHAKGMCKRCYLKRYNEDNKERHAALTKRYYEDNKEHILARTKRYNEDNKEHILARNKRYYEDNKKAFAARNKRYNEDNREALATHAKQYYEDNREDNGFTVRGSDEHRIKMSCAQQHCTIDEWDGFAVESKYCPKFNNACRERNREKYGRRCFVCGKTEAENGKRLSVHHVDMEKQQGCNGHVWQLVPLCSKHHGSSHNDMWQARIQYLLEHVW